ncbi:MAG: UvrD-helicase domain-containing protein, partial [bacterium]
MNKAPPFEIPDVTDEDICWAARLLILPENAFHGADGKDPRQNVLKAKEQIDVAACPGSGKTTLLVAKLAILAEKWQHPTRGMCILSHTNVARNQIERYFLGNTTAGRRLLSYPHYVGTIHGFVNEFLAKPWLRSHGYPIKIIDSDICESRRWHKLEHRWRHALTQKRLDISNIRIVDTRFRLAKKNGTFPIAEDKDTYKNLQKVCEDTTNEGYYCYDDMFIWAEDLLEKFDWVTKVIRHRFPLLFIDEAQDNSKKQSEILRTIFIKGDDPVLRQRFGDANQAIFNFLGEKGATTDEFPDSGVRKDVPNSHRFGQKIADFVKPLEISPHPDGLTGQGPPGAEGQHTIFLFTKNSVEKVLVAYAELLIETFNQEELRKGEFTAVGLRHRPPDKEETKKFPHHIGDYWPEYDPELTPQDPKPRTFVQYLAAGVGKAEKEGEAFHAVEKIAEGILRLAGMAKSETAFPRRQRNHRYILELLEDCADVRGNYNDLIVEFAIDREAPTKETWESRWRTVVHKIAEAITGVCLASDEVEEFLKCNDGPNASAASSSTRTNRDNIYRFSRDGKEVAIRVGSIHSVKGQTHTATLVLETFWRGRNERHNLELLLPWLSANRSRDPNIRVEQLSRLKTHY